MAESKRLIGRKHKKKKKKSELGRQPPTSEYGTHIKRMLKFCTFIFCL
jgi:ribosomal protein S8E